MRTLKIRGGRRTWKTVQPWVKDNLTLLDTWFYEYGYQYADIVVHPWCDISLTYSKIPSPHGKTRKLIIEGLIKIYSSWKEQLDKLGQPYYLKIWLCEPRIEKSQVVCAIGERIEWYENVFTQTPSDVPIRLNQFGQSGDNLDLFRWASYLDEEVYDDSDLGEPGQYASLKDYYSSVKWFNKIKKRAVKSGDTYRLKKGIIWVGELK